MLHTFFSGPLWQLIYQADGATKMVLGTLLCMSILCWSLFIYKYLLLRSTKQHMNQLLTYMRMMSTMEDLALIGDKYRHTLAGYVLTTTLQSFKALVELKRQQGDIGKLGIAHWERLQDSMYHAIDETLCAQESGLWVLSTSAAAATLLGLFGTVWGLVHAFMSISEKQAADIATVAPGIAEALITTLAGLMVAIPALVMFNYLSRQLARAEQQLHTLAQGFNRIIQIMFVY
jgi:biopolymer transport protein ExbB/TolQ